MLPAVALGSRFAQELPELAMSWQADRFPDPQLLLLDEDLAAELGLYPAWLRTPAGVAFLSGQVVPEGAAPVAQAYAGHQFGGFSPQLGDGRALLLGEVVDRAGRRRDIAFKGSGRTPFSRGGDGKGLGRAGAGVEGDEQADRAGQCRFPYWCGLEQATFA